MNLWTRKHVEKRVPAFEVFLNERGAEVLKTTNEWELVRFVCAQGTSIIYTNKNNGITFVGEAQRAWNAFIRNDPWRAVPATKRIRMTPIVATIRARDGGCCFYCHLPVPEEESSVEHLISLTHGGPNHISNLFLTHARCNLEAGNLSAPEKVRRSIEAALKLQLKGNPNAILL